MRKLYMLVNSSSAIPIVSMHITQAQFIRLGEDALKFLAGVWLQPASSTFHPAQYAALRHAAAFMEAHHSSQRYIDFQTILPAVLVAAQLPDHRVREAALECVTALVRLAQAKKPIGVYAFDAVYGATSGWSRFCDDVCLKLTQSTIGELQYLDWSDLSKYVHALHNVKEHLANDASYLRVFHQQHLLTVKSEGKKEAGYVPAILFRDSKPTTTQLQEQDNLLHPVSCYKLHPPVHQDLASHEHRGCVQLRQATNATTDHGEAGIRDYKWRRGTHRFDCRLLRSDRCWSFERPLRPSMGRLPQSRAQVLPIRRSGRPKNCSCAQTREGTIFEVATRSEG